MIINLKNKLISYYDINEDKSKEYIFNDLVSNNNGVLKNFTDNLYINDEDMKYIKFLNNDNCIQIPTISHTDIKALAFTIKINSLVSGTIISSSSLYLFDSFKSYTFQSLINNIQKSINIQGSDILNKKITVYVDLIDKKFYINNKDITLNTNIGAWSHEDVTGIIIGKSYYNSFNGNLYDMSFFNEPLNEFERTILFNMNNKLIIHNRYLLKENDNYYSIKPEYYINNNYQVLNINNFPTKEDFETYGFTNLNSLIEDVTINEEVIKPIDKFNNFKIISDYTKDISIKGIKSNKELVISNNNFSTRISNNIDYFKLQDSSNDIKIIFSIDNGIIWKSYNDNHFINLDISIPTTKSYNEFSNDEKQKWNEAITIIEQNGISVDMLQHIDFNKLNISNIRFGYLLSSNSPIELSYMTQLIWQFDSKGSMRLCKDSDIDIELYYGGLKLISNIDIDMIKTNITYEGIGEK